MLEDEEEQSHHLHIEMNHGKGRSEGSLTKSLTAPSTPESAIGLALSEARDDITLHPILHDRHITKLPVDGDHRV